MSLFAVAHTLSLPIILCTAAYVTLKSTLVITDTFAQLLPTALPPCSWCHYSHTERRRSLRSLLRGEETNPKRMLDNVNSCFLQWQGREMENRCTQIKLAIVILCETAPLGTSGQLPVKDERVCVYHRPFESPPTSPSWVNTSCCPQKGHCLNDRWRACRDKKHADTVVRHLTWSLWVSRVVFTAFSDTLQVISCSWPLVRHLRENGVVEYSRESKVYMADDVAEVFTWLKRQRVAGFVSVNNDLQRKESGEWFNRQQQRRVITEAALTVSWDEHVWDSLLKDMCDVTTQLHFPFSEWAVNFMLRLTWCSGWEFNARISKKLNVVSTCCDTRKSRKVMNPAHRQSREQHLSSLRAAGTTLAGIFGARKYRRHVVSTYGKKTWSCSVIREKNSSDVQQ